MRQADNSQTSKTAGAGQLQFSLRFLLLLITLAAIVLAVGIRWGAFATLTPLVLAVVGLNRAVYCRPVQGGAARLIVCGLSCLAFTASFFLPTLRLFSDELVGWEVAGFVYESNFDLLTGNTANFAWSADDLLAASVFLAAGTANILMLWAPAAVFVKRGRGAWFAALLITSVSAFAFSLDDTSDYGSGYFVWSLAFILISTAFPIGRRLFWVYIVLLAAMAMRIILWQSA